MVEQNVGERSVFFIGVKVIKVNTSGGEGLVGRGKDGERPRALERCNQIDVGQSGHEGVVNPGPCSVGWYVLRGVRSGVNRKSGGGQERDDQESERFVHRDISSWSWL